MSNKGAKGQRRMAEQDRSRYWSMIDQERADRGEARDTLMPHAERLLDSGYSPEEESAMLQSSMGSVGSAYDVARDRAERRMARTGNTAGYMTGMGELTRDEARTKADVKHRTTKDFADERQRRKTAGLQLISNLYGIDTSLLQSLSGRPLQALGEHSRGIEDPWWKTAVGAGTRLGSAAILAPTGGGAA